MSTGRQNVALGAYGERVAARHLVDDGLEVLDRNWRCDAGEIDLVLRDGDVLVFCEVKTRRGTAYGHPLEAVDAVKSERLVRLGGALARRRTPSSRRTCASTSWRCCGRDADAAEVEHVRGLALMWASTRTVSLQGAHRARGRRPGRREPGHDRDHLVGRPDASINEAPGPLPVGDRQQRLRVAEQPSGSRSCCRRPTCPSAVRTSTSRSRSRCWRRRGSSSPPVRSTTWCSIGELTLDGRLRLRARRAADGDGRGAAVASGGSWSPSRSCAEAALVGGVEVYGVRSLAPGGRAPPGRRAPRGAAGRAAHRAAAAQLARRRATRGGRPRRRARHGRCALRPRGGGGRRPPPDAHRAEGRRQDDPGRAAPDDPARPEPRGVAGADRDPFAVRRACPRASTVLTRPPFRAPHHSASRAGDPRRRHRPGPARAR